MAMGAISAIQDSGLAVGKDISVTGFDNIPSAAYTHPPLTTVSQPIFQIGGMVCEILIRMVKQISLEKKQIRLNPSLIERQSTGAPLKQ
jgi:LacI family transcriptional regulator